MQQTNSFDSVTLKQLIEYKNFLVEYLDFLCNEIDIIGSLSDEGARSYKKKTAIEQGIHKFLKDPLSLPKTIGLISYLEHVILIEAHLLELPETYNTIGMNQEGLEHSLFFTFIFTSELEALGESLAVDTTNVYASSLNQLKRGLNILLRQMQTATQYTLNQLTVVGILSNSKNVQHRELLEDARIRELLFAVKESSDAQLVSVNRVLH